MDIKWFYVNKNMYKSEYIMMQIYMVPQKFVEKYNFKEKAHNKYILARITEVIYGLPQEVRIAHYSLVNHLEPYGYLPAI